MAEYLADFDNINEALQFNGRPYLFEPEYMDKELLEMRGGQREGTGEVNQLALFGCVAAMATDLS